jgi:hypothetical protein
MPANPPRNDGNAPDQGSTALRALIRTTQGGVSRPLRIERDEGRLRVVLDEAPTAADAPSKGEVRATAPANQAALMRADLKSHLDRRTGTRAILPHLGILEHELGKRGMRTFNELPLTVLRRAAGQLNGLAEEPLLEGFVLLQAWLDMSIVDREERAQAETRQKLLLQSTLLIEDKLLVSEASMSDFLRVVGEPPEPFDAKMA